MASNIRRRSSGFTWPMDCINLLLSSSFHTSPGPSEMLYHGMGRPSNPCQTSALPSPLLQSFLQTHTLASTRDSELSDLIFRGCQFLTSFSSWTFLTWLVVVGSSVVMLLWIVIYSFFESSDFNDEVVILFGNVPFWACVVISVVIALGESYSIEVSQLLPIIRQHPGSWSSLSPHRTCLWIVTSFAKCGSMVTSKTVSESSTGRTGKRATSRELLFSINHMQGPSPKCLLYTRAGGLQQRSVTWILQRQLNEREAHLHNHKTHGLYDNVFRATLRPLRQQWGQVRQ